MKNDKCWYKDVCDNQCESCIRFEEMNYLIQESGIPYKRSFPASLIAGCDYAAFCRLADIKDNILDIVKKGDYNLYIASTETGNGKTSWAIKLLLKYFDRVWAGNGFRARGLFVHVPTLLLQMKNFQDPVPEDYKRKLMNCDLVVFDDICTSNISNFDYNNLLMVIDNRMLNGKVNIFTGNRVKKEDLENVLGSRLASRIWQASEVIIFNGKDRRNGFTSDNQ